MCSIVGSHCFDLTCLQVECEPADNIMIHVDKYRATEGGWIRLAFRNVAGDAGINRVELAADTTKVGPQASRHMGMRVPGSWLCDTPPSLCSCSCCISNVLLLIL